MKLFLDSSAFAKRFVEEPGSQEVEIINLTPEVVHSSIEILETTPVRTMDALHIASALAWGADLFASADHRQIAAAKTAGLETKQL